jgi:hypothetical protein
MCARLVRYLFEDGDGDHTCWPHLTRTVPSVVRCVRWCACVRMRVLTSRRRTRITEQDQFQARQQPAAARERQARLLRPHRHTRQQRVRENPLAVTVPL